MDWFFNGSVGEAVALAKRRDVLFVVAVHADENEDDATKRLFAALNANKVLFKYP